MSMPTIIRPELSDDKRREMKEYLSTQWLRAKQGRQEQVDAKYPIWNRAYDGIPLEKIRTVPFYKASNFVVKLIRIFLDTFMARTLNIVFATKPVYVLDTLPRDQREACEMYLNKKAEYEWNHYWLLRDLIMRGNKNGTCIVKTVYKEDERTIVTSEGGRRKDTPYMLYSGPDSRCIPFEDFYIHPITANRLCDADIIFHRVRYPEQEARELVDKGTLRLPPEKNIETYLRPPRDVKKVEQQTEAGLYDPYSLELSTIECSFRWAVDDKGDKRFDVTGVLTEEDLDLVDLYFNCYPYNECIYTDYRPFPREDLFYGESLSEILAQSQEEASRIHNERRDNSTIASSVIFKRRNGSLLPNPSTNWYPGKVFDLDSMDDLDVITIGRNYDDMIQQEDYTFAQAEKLSGIGEIQQAGASGTLDKRGIYNTMGTIALMQEGNQRQDTNMRDVRQVIGAIARMSLRLQATYGSNDPLIDMFDKDVQQQVRAALDFFKTSKARYVLIEAKASNAGVNKQIERTNLQMTAQVLQQYGGQVQAMAQQLMNAKINPGLRMIMNDIVKMQRWMAQRLLREFDEWDATEILPDVDAAVESVIPGGSRGTETLRPGGDETGMDLGPAQGPPTAPSRSQLASLATMGVGPQGGNGARGMGQ